MPPHWHPVLGPLPTSTAAPPLDTWTHRRPFPQTFPMAGEYRESYQKQRWKRPCVHGAEHRPRPGSGGSCAASSPNIPLRWTPYAAIKRRGWSLARCLALCEKRLPVEVLARRGLLACAGFRRLRHPCRGPRTFVPQAGKAPSRALSSILLERAETASRVGLGRPFRGGA